ncbi:MAG: hydrolase [Myxococcaceae bacterium]|nr:hydrolase [Myxococcaceae bacterium]
MAASDARNPFGLLSSRPVYDNPWIEVIEHQICKPRGGTGVYGVVHYKNRAVGVVPYERGEIWLVGQWRFPLARYSWEIPEGGAPSGEDVEACARRELEEEAGLVAGQLRPLLTMHLSNSVSDEVAHVFVATELSPGISAPDDTEELALRKLPLEQAYREVLAGEITDSMSVAAILRLMLMVQSGELR